MKQRPIRLNRSTVLAQELIGHAIPYRIGQIFRHLGQVFPSAAHMGRNALKPLRLTGQLHQGHGQCHGRGAFELTTQLLALWQAHTP